MKEGEREKERDEIILGHLIGHLFLGEQFFADFVLHLSSF